MRYHREFKFSAAHFNSMPSYHIAWNHTNESDDALFKAMFDIHGHNFKVVVDIVGENDAPNHTPWLVDDIRLERVVMQWAGINLSLHPDFFAKQMRATTENMADILLAKLQAEFPDVMIEQVVVWETEDIHASATGV